MWGIVQAMLNVPVPRCPFANFAVASKCSLAGVLKYLADNFCRVLPPGTGIKQHLAPNDLARRPYCLDDEFTLTELHSALRTCCRCSAPGEDDVTYQALKNRNESLHPQLLQVYNLAW